MFALKSTAKLPFFSHSAKFPAHFFLFFGFSQAFFFTVPLHYAIVMHPWQKSGGEERERE